MFRLSIDSEIGPLRQVVVHRPGDEVVHMTQHELDLLLFDDILSPAETVREHELMAEILSQAGAEVIEVLDLLEEALERAPREARRKLLQRCTALAGATDLVDLLTDWEPAQLAHGLVSGVYWRDVSHVGSLRRIRSQLRGPEAMALRPTPNLMFMRDPGFAVGGYWIPSRMATQARAREPELVAFALRHSRLVEDVSLLFDARDDELGTPHVSIEGGDVLVLSPQVIMIGCSQRTTAEGIERLARSALFAALPSLERVYAVMMPEERSVMHLDTVLTQVDHSLFLGHKPMIAASGGAALSVARMTRSGAVELLDSATVMDVLREELGEDTELVPCGGEDPLHQQREQWTDGANALALAPGRVILYARNVYTIRELGERGFEEVRLHSVQPPDQRAELIAEGMRRDRTVFSFSGSELSRARGGGRCLTMPLRRAGA